MELHAPETVESAIQILSSRKDALPLAGGQEIVAGMNSGALSPSCVVSLAKIPALRGIRAGADGSVTIGAMVTHREIAASEVLTGGQTVLGMAARELAHPSIRNAGTIGGAVCQADPKFDYPAGLVAAAAEVELTGPDGVRLLAAGEFFLAEKVSALAQGEIVTAVRLPPSGGSAGAYVKFSRVDTDYAILSVAVVLQSQGGVCKALRIALGSCGPVPVRSEKAEAALIGTALGDDDIAQAAAWLVAECAPRDDIRASADYRRMLVPGLLRRAIRKAQGESGQ